MKIQPLSQYQCSAPGNSTDFGKTLFKDPDDTGSKVRGSRKGVAPRLGGYDFWLLAKAMFRERGGRNRLRGANPLGDCGIVGWALDALTDKRGGNEFH